VFFFSPVPCFVCDCRPPLLKVEPGLTKAESGSKERVKSKRADSKEDNESKKKSSPLANLSSATESRLSSDDVVIVEREEELKVACKLDLPQFSDGGSSDSGTEEVMPKPKLKV
jgi:hypothetical protein